ncbi:MAG: hypothetical protein WCO09_02780 [bacterium]
MKKHNGGGILTLLLEVIGLLVIVVGAYIYLRLNTNILDETTALKNTGTSTSTNLSTGTGVGSSASVSTSTAVGNVIPNGKCGLSVTSTSPNSKVGFPLVIKGVVDNTKSKVLGCSWQMFEGQAGIAQLYFKDNNEWKKLGASVPVPVENWTSDKTIFSVVLNSNNEGVGLPNGTLLKVIFTEENASGMPPVDTYELPLVLDTSL